MARVKQSIRWRLSWQGRSLSLSDSKKDKEK